MGTWPCKPLHATRRCCRALVRAQVLSSCADVCLLIPARVCTQPRDGSTHSGSTHSAHGDARARVRVNGVRVRVNGAHQPSNIVSPSESADPSARKVFWGAGLWQVRRIQKHESCVERASARALRMREVQCKMAMQSGSRSRIESRASGCERRGAGAPLTQEHLTLTAQHASARYTLLRQRARRARSEFSAACHSRLAGSSCVCMRASVCESAPARGCVRI